MIIVFCVDCNYVKYSLVAIESYRKYNPQAKIVVVSEIDVRGIGEDEHFVIKLPRTFRNRGDGDRISNTAYLKLFLTQLPYDKIIYVDADTLCQHSLDELWAIPCDYINLCESHSFGEKQAKALNVPKYGLTGMMVMNLQKLRWYNFTGKCLEVEKNYPTPVTGWQHDETCINVAMQGKLKFIDYKYNYCHKRNYAYPIPEKDAYILHFVGKDKQDIFGEQRYETISHIGREIVGKNIAIVGNAKSIFDKNWGEEIDSHPFVIRFNKGYGAKPESQGVKTSLLLLACYLSIDEIRDTGAKWLVNRSSSYRNPACATITNKERKRLKDKLGSQPSTGFMAIDLCLYFGASHIDLYGFDWDATPTFYNDPNYKTQHDYKTEERLIQEYETQGKLTIHR